MPSAYTDESEMPMGAHRGKKMANVPGPYLLWLWEQPWLKDYKMLYQYIKQNLEVIKKRG